MKGNMMTIERRLGHDRRRRPRRRHGVSVPISKKCRGEHLIRRRLAENLRYYKLRSIIPSQTSKKIRSRDDEDEDEVRAATNTTRLQVSTLSPNLKIQEEQVVLVVEREECEPCCSTSNRSTEVIFENPEEPFVPTIAIREMEGNSLLINAVVNKNVSLTSNLFRIFEEEENKIVVLFENQYRTESNASHTIHLDVQPDYDVGTLEKKLCAWAGETTLLRRFN
ncbi:hypothetical protein Scep_015411 [Stephania cephalantha]|uniref:Uncharacterized protein n=1 Tax=Stephania cephalantha TaxID=152367 RepID=A0AAP0P2S7_9MAGN